MATYIRQPIVSILGHIDHGKTSIADRIRGTTVAARESGGITQHIGATEVPLDAILKACGDLVAGKEFKVPGLLFIDTPGHAAFVTLRARGGALADLAVLVIDINEGFRPQTVESLNILKRFRTPFVIAANKIDLIPGWRKHAGGPLGSSLKDQPPATQSTLDERLYNLVGEVFKHGFTAERYDRIEDFATTVAIVPTSGKTGEGIPDLLLVLIGLAQRFLERELRTEEGPAEGTVLEVKEDKGLGLTVDAIIYSGVLRKGDTIVLGTTGRPAVTKVKAILKPKPLDEIRDPQDRFDSVTEVSAAAGVKISASNLEGVVSGGPLRTVDRNLSDVTAAVAEESQIRVETATEGLLVKADALGSLEALAYECKKAGIPIKFARIGPVARRDIVDSATVSEPLLRAILAFNVPILPDAKAELASAEVKVIENDVIFRLIEEYQAWREERKRGLEEAKRLEVNYPGKLLFLENHTFRVSKPAIFGVRVLAGRIRPGQSVMRDDGRTLGRVRSIRSGEDVIREARAGQEVAIAVEGVTVGRQVKEGDVLFVDLNEKDAIALRDEELNADEKEVLEQIAAVKRRTDPFWGM